MLGDLQAAACVVGLANRFALLLGIVVLGLALAAAPVPLTIALQNPTRYVTLFPNVLFAVPLTLVAALLLLYGVTSEASKVTRANK